MKKRILLTVLMVLVLTFGAGCGAKEELSVGEDNGSEATVEESVTKPENATEETIEAETDFEEEISPAESDDLTFADLAQYRFEFSSGAGGWLEEFTIEKDGYFTGKFHDLDMGVTGEGYENGTFYSCVYSGHFTELVKINDYTYEMKLADITYDDPVGTEEIRESVYYIYTDSYCLGGSDTFTIYLPGTPLEELSEDVKMWLYWANESEEELTIVAIADNINGYGIYSYDRMPPLEDAQMTYNTYKESYDYYMELATSAETTPEMVEYTGRMYEVADSCLNYIWNLVRYNVDEKEYAAILEEQRAWIAEKEAEAKEVSAEFEGGTFEPVSYNDTLASLTIYRCEELIEYLK